MQICCFTGHRQLSEQDNIQLTTTLENEINTLISQGVTTFLSGGALGFDQLCANLIIDKKQLNPTLQLIFILPCPKQDKFWTFNQKLIQLSDICLCALRNNHSGTAQTVRLAKAKCIPIINVLTKF